MNLSEKFLPLLSSMNSADLEEEIALPSKLLIQSQDDLSVAYAPFDHINPSARVVIVGITPGRQQMGNALREARRLLLAGNSISVALTGAKTFASFSGPMRSNLIDMLNYVGLNEKLKLTSTASLWGKDDSIAHFTSALRYPVFFKGENYSGNPDMTKTPFLRKHLFRWLASEMEALPKAIFIPLGPKVTSAVQQAASFAGISHSRILDGLPHPSGANAERIAFFLGRKPQGLLSKQVNPEALIQARTRILSKVQHFDW